MEVNILDLQKLFASPVRYEIPLFQRPYVWKHAEQWAPLWEDVQNTAENYLQHGTPLDGTRAHFLGAVVLQQQQVQTPMLMTRLVVDGQQRLTTLQLLLDAVQEVFEKRGNEYAAKRLEILVLNPEAFRGDDPSYAFKVWPTMVDQEAFRHTMHNDLPSEPYEESLIVQAHEFFKDQVSQWLDAEPLNIEKRADALERAVSKLLELVVIDLDQSDDPHVIFETLNARGTALLQSDLVKNLILYEAEKNGINNKEADGLWDFQDSWWRQDIQQGRLVRPRIDVYLNYWMVMRETAEVAANDVFSVFRRYHNNSGNAIEDIAADISYVGKFYRALEEVSIPHMEQFIYRWRVMQAGVITPVLLWLLSSNVAEHQLDKSLRALESHQLRRMVCRMSTMGLNRLFIALVERLERAGPENAGDIVVQYLGNQDSGVGLWPSDQQLENAFTTLPLYRLLTRGRLRMVLEGIEEELRTDKSETQSVPLNLTIEHIMPRQWRHHWALPTEVEDMEEKEKNRDYLIHSIGNLTLVNGRLNSELSNAPWNEKQATLNEHSVLFLNKTLQDQSFCTWNESMITERAKLLCAAAVKVWPQADKL